MTRYKGVQGGTVTGVPLCRTCSFAHYVQGESVSSKRLFCRALQEDGASGELNQEMYECTVYADKRLPSLDMMHRTGWVLRTDEFRNAIGFVSPQEWRQKYRKTDDPSAGPY